MYSEKDQKEMTDDLLVNNLIYVTPEPLSLAVNRTQSRNFFQRSVYNAGETARIDINSGSEYCDPINSYLVFSVQLVGTGAFTANFGSGSATNLINQVVLRSKSGTELDRVQNCNIWSRISTINRESRAYLETTGSSEGWDISALLGISGQTYPLNVNTPTTFAIPLKRLSGFFEPLKNGQLLPASVFSGLTMEIIWEDYRTALVSSGAGGTCTGYTISNLSLVCDTVALTDDVQKTLNSISSKSGLECTYCRVYTSINDMPSSQNTLSAQVRKAVSNCSYAVAVVLDPTKIRDITVDSFASLSNTLTNYQWRLGSLYFPLQPVADPNSSGIEPFIASKMTFNKLHNEHQEGAVTLNMFKNGANCIAGSFEKSQALEVSGLALNNSRVLELDCTFSNSVSRQVYVFMCYNSISRSYLDNTSVAL